MTYPQPDQPDQPDRNTPSKLNYYHRSTSSLYIPRPSSSILRDRVAIDLRFSLSCTTHTRARNSFPSLVLLVCPIHRLLLHSSTTHPATTTPLQQTHFFPHSPPRRRSAYREREEIERERERERERVSERGRENRSTDHFPNTSLHVAKISQSSGAFSNQAERGIVLPGELVCTQFVLRLLAFNFFASRNWPWKLGKQTTGAR